MDVNKINGEQYCMNCKYWKKVWNKKYNRPCACCTNDKSDKVWFANQLNGCDYFDGKLQPKKDWSKATIMGYRPSTFSRF